MNRLSRELARVSGVLCLLGAAAVSEAQELKTARIGDLTLERGGLLRDCVIGYRTFGRLDASRSNAVLLPTAFGDTSGGTASRVGPGKVVDSTRYFVIVVDSLGDGVSSSPSNSSSQPGPSFPEFSMRDMVNAEKRLVTEVLHLPHLLAIVGFSMGGMQAFQWAVSYPEFVSKVVSIAGSPQLTSYDRLLWRTSILALKSDPDWAEGRYKKQPQLHLMNMVLTLVVQTPEYVATHTSREGSRPRPCALAGDRQSARSPGEPSSIA
jgi:homoserine O-acetyltransferase